ncbi:nucleotidyl transferase AbiEii/AbiGii toxin family protein [Sphaerisporangium sp. NPDC005288]|uniref:nucleotidyl transferase AbiEii/AbiGii toxin family protein n=1 Tax=unclassified Sphaerisporangium TaxID=2630420 RepID=UPI0033ADD32B
MDMPPFHRRILDAALQVCDAHGLVLAGGYAMRAHGLVERPSQDLDFATVAFTPLEEITGDLARALERDGLEVRHQRDSARLARLTVSDPVTAQSAAVDLMKEPLQRPAVDMEICPVASMDDVVGMKVGALCGRALPRDFIDVLSVADRYADRYGLPDLERLGALFEDGFSLENLAFKLESGLTLDDALFAQYGLDEREIARVKAFILSWYEDLSLRIAEETELDPDQ